MAKAPTIGFGKYIISATTPFTQADLVDLNMDAPLVVKRLFPNYEAAYVQRGWKMFPKMGRVYVNEAARRELGWSPTYDFASVIESLNAGKDIFSPLTYTLGKKGYHQTTFENGPYPV